MAEEGHYHFNATVITRSGGANAVRSAAYRAGEKLKDRRTGKVYDRSDRAHEIVHSEIIAPENAPEWVMDREKLWNEVEAKEDTSTRRKDAQLAREIDIAIPHQLPEQERIELIRSFVREQFVAKGMIADVAWHAPPEQGDERNYHAHIMLTMREVGSEGFGNKGRNWNSDILIRHWRKQWAVYANRALEGAGLDIRLDHRTLEERGIDREPTTHCGPAKTDKKRRRKREVKKSRLEEQAQELDEPAAKPVVRTKLYPTEEGVGRAHVLELVEAQDHVMTFRAQENQARYAGERQRDARRALSKLDWQIEQDAKRVQEHEERFNKAMEIAFQDPKSARQTWDEHVATWNLAQLQERGPRALGRLRGFALFGFKTKERMAAEQAARRLSALWEHQRQVRLRIGNLESERMIADATLQRSVRDYTSARERLGTDKQRNQTRQKLYERRAAALRKVKPSEIWECALPEEQRAELAAEWESSNVRSAERAADRERHTAPEKRATWDLWAEERQADKAPEQIGDPDFWHNLEKEAEQERERTNRARHKERQR